MKSSSIAIPAISLMQAAVPVFASPVWSDALTVNYMDGGASMTVYFNEATPNPASCMQTLKTVSWEATNPDAKNFMSMMLAAKVAGRSVQVLVDDAGCLWGGWPKLLSMKLF
jgi:hypothetical protein